MCAAFLLAWSPYAVISMWSALGHSVPPLNGLVAALFAKSASFYNPFIYMGLSAKFRADLRELFPLHRCPRWRPGAGLQLHCPSPYTAAGGGAPGILESSSKDSQSGGGLTPNAVLINLDRFKEPIPEEEGRVRRLGVDSGVETGRSSTGSTVPLVKREAGVGGEREDRGRKVTGGDEEGQKEEEEEQREETDCLRSPLVTYSAPAPHTYSHTYSQMYSLPYTHPHSHTQPQRGFIRRQSNSGRL